ncbi:hypothetical protein EJ05DRAFT_377342 [Pseudovirgaria hyperparasitica]|uniref:Uncharacterized protein n=1 Tax=Pseudovirgaria hyperparasitica TaxID=470096 RepID=A0A6A6W6D8_9PEZI|nr:uncharacterized protein EJ05DRAFT_377342 [Pseudovirgaria hyperparasitica]KAF2758105.1 hypothetical protein EJ05DRAFT_377342 [Pseudovirgaria hyperparasitica]
MAATNGNLAPSDAAIATPLSPSGLKRKRSESATGQQNGDSVTPSKPVPESSEKENFFSVQKAVLGILESYDTKPSLLEQPIPDVQHTSSAEHTAKRTKTSDEPQARSIKDKLQNGSYMSFEPLLADVEIASTHLLSTSKIGSDDGSVQSYKPPSLAETRLITGIYALKKVLRNQVLREVSQRTSKLEDSGKDSGAKVNGDAVKSPTEVTGTECRVATSKKVLTMFANAQGPKTLFSSLQQPAHVETSNKNPTGFSTSIDVTLPMNDGAGLPGMIRITEAVPVQCASKRTPTIGELFAPPATVPQLSPPKPAKPLTTKGSVVTWVAEDSLSKSHRKGKTYFSEPLATGQWLGYGGVDSSEEPTTLEAKAKHRQRALSTGAARPPVPAAAVAALQQARDDALFRSAFSSFAPSHDDTVAIVPSSIKNRVWWHKIGSKTVQEEVPVDPALYEQAVEDDAMEDAPAVDTEAEEEVFKQVVEHYEEEDLEAALGLRSKEDKEVDEVLKEISELIETLHSYQRIRNSTLAGNLRTPVTSSAPVLNGTPSSPSSAEVDIYKILRSQLSLLVSSLPPYAVAKLNGEQLAALNISRNMVVETKTYEGVLEEDQVSRLAKSTSLGATPSKAVGVTPNHSTPFSSYGRVPPATSHGHSSRPSTYFQPQQSQNAHRPSYAPTPSFFSGQRPPYTPQPPRGGYAQQTYYQGQPRPPPGYQVQATTYYNSPAVPQAQHRGGYTPQPHAYTARPQPVAPMYPPAAHSPHTRTASPLKPTPTPTPMYPQQSPSRPGSYTPGPPRPSSSSFHPQQQGSGAPNEIGPSGFHSSMTGEQQQSMVDRHRANLANGGRATPVAAESRAGSGTPGVERESGTPMST